MSKGTADQAHVEPGALACLHLHHQDRSRRRIRWRAALTLASDLSRTHAPRLGARSSDVLHVACALALELAHFLAIDEPRRMLSKAAGLKRVKP